MQNAPVLLTVADGGIQTVPMEDSTASPQIVYLDFDGAVTSYVNADLGVAIGSITVEPSGFGEDDTAAIAAALNGMFDDVVFTTEIPTNGAFSTVYVGVTSAFDEYGEFLGLAETIDSGNQIRDDNAFVLLDSSSTPPPPPSSSSPSSPTRWSTSSTAWSTAARDWTDSPPMPPSMSATGSPT